MINYFAYTQLFFYLFCALCPQTCFIDGSKVSSISVEAPVSPLEPSEMFALQELFLATSGEGWNWVPNFNKTNWDSTKWNFSGNHNPCVENWQFLRCTIPIGPQTNYHIVDMQFYRTNMVGSLPVSIGNFPELTRIIIDQNEHLIGTLPINIGNLTKLTYFGLGYTGMSGVIPDQFCNLTSLKRLYIFQNNFHGHFPPYLTNFQDLIVIRLANNMFSGSLPHQLCHLDNLTHIDVGYNNFTGTIPGCYFKGKLKNLYANSNFLDGTVPSQISNATGLSAVFLFLNSFSGQIPDISKLLTLKYFISNANMFTGTITDSIYTSPYIEVLEFSANSLTGSLPGVLVETDGSHKHNSTLSYSFAHNMLTGTIPIILTQTLHLSYFYLGFNYLTGHFPIITTDKAVAIVLSNNLLSGPLIVPSNRSREFQTLSINNNFFSGTLPLFRNTLNTLYLQNNELTGLFPEQLADLHENMTYNFDDDFTYDNKSVNSSKLFYDFTFVDVSNNRLTGTLPTGAFASGQLNKLRSFAAASNCFSGTIPASLCNTSTLRFLDLDGLSTSSACRTPLFTQVPAIHSFLLRNQIVGEIPTCLFGMPVLETIHLCGNNINWHFPETLTIGSKLVNLSLAHNQLTGTVPSSVWKKQWEYLNLSFNKLTGVIPRNLSIATNSTLTLQVNRLSGPIPHKLKYHSQVNILNGNLFDCDLRRSQLPRSDNQFEIYQCGSNSFNQSTIIWTTVLIVLMITAIICLGYSRRNPQSDFIVFNLVSAFIKRHKAYADAIVSNKYNLLEFGHYLTTLRVVFITLTTLVCVIGVPLYTILTVYFKTLTYEYAWIVSAAYLSGKTPAIVLLFAYTCWISFVFKVRLRLDKRSSMLTRHTELFVSNWKRSLLLTVVLIVNGFVMLVANGGYVYVLLNYNSHVIFVMQVLMALFKLCWNEFGLRGMMRFIRRITPNHEGSNVIYNELDVIMETPVMSFMILFNTIIAPCLATACVDPSCFVNAFIQPPSVTTTFPSFSCGDIDSQYGECSSVLPTESFITLSYEPPFTYRYQCTSAILTNYASVYVYMFLFVAFVKPVLLTVMTKFYAEVQEGVVLHVVTSFYIFNLLKDANNAQDPEDSLLFHKERFTLRMLSKIAVFFTFGVVFPPLAVVICVAIVSETYLNQVVLGRFLELIEFEGVREQFAKKLHKDCEGAMELLLLPLTTLVVPLSALFYAFFLFDMYGDHVGAKHALLVGAPMAALPGVIWVCYKLYLECNVKGVATQDVSRDTVVELTHNKMFDMKERNTTDF